MPCCRASCTAAAQSGSGIGERCARVLRQRSNCWRACSILTGTTGVFKRDISLFSLPWLGDRLTLSRSFRWGHAALPKPHDKERVLEVVPVRAGGPVEASGLDHLAVKHRKLVVHDGAVALVAPAQTHRNSSRGKIRDLRMGLARLALVGDDADFHAAPVGGFE